MIIAATPRSFFLVSTLIGLQRPEKVCVKKILPAIYRRIETLDE